MEQYANLISFHGESHCFFSGQNKNIIQRKDKYGGFSGICRENLGVQANTAH